MESTSTSLIGKLVAADSEAWRTFDAIYRPFLLQFIGRYSHRPTDAEDVVQVVLIKVMTLLPGFERRHHGAFRGWLRKLTSNEILTRSKRQSPQSLDSTAIEALATDDSDLARHWDAEHDAHVTRQLLALVEPEFAAVHWRAFRRVFFDNVPATVAATETGLTVQAVYMAKHDILKQLREVGQVFLE